MSEIERLDGNVFDSLRREDEQGEYWSARELQRPLGYRHWEGFADSIERAKAAAENSGVPSGSQIRDVPNLVQTGLKGVTRDVGDYRLTRYAAYLVAMNGDPRKPEIAAAQTYFAVRTHEAEVAAQPTSALDLAEVMLRSLRQQETRVAALESNQVHVAQHQRELEARLDGIEGKHDWFSALAYARMNGLPTERRFLQRLGTAAGRVTRRDGEQPAKTQHELYGSVNLYPLAALDEAAELVGGAA